MKVKTLKRLFTALLILNVLLITLGPVHLTATQTGTWEKTTYEGRTAWVYIHKSADNWFSRILGKTWTKTEVRFEDGTGFQIYNYANGKEVKFFIPETGGENSNGGVSGGVSGGPGSGGTL